MRRRTTNTYVVKPVRSSKLVTKTPPRPYRRILQIDDRRSIASISAALRMRPQSLIGSFTYVGIRGLTPDHLVSKEEIESLVSFFRAGKRDPATIAFEDDKLLQPKIVVVNSLNAKLLEQLAHRPQLLHALSSRKFEEIIANLLEDQGCEVTLTKRTRDGGYDIFGRMKAGPTNVVFLAECKRYSRERKVGVEVVRGLYGVTESRGANLGLIITSSSFTKDAISEKLRIGPRIDLKEFDDLCGWLAPYTNRKV